MWQRLRKKIVASKTWLQHRSNLPALLRDQIEQKIWQETLIEVQDFIQQLHRDLAFSIIWQNGLLLIAILLSWYAKSSWPFYFCYGVIWAYSVWRSYQLRQYVLDWWRCKSLTAMLAHQISLEIELKLQQAGRLERWLVRQLGPEISELSQRFAARIYPDLRLALWQAGFSLGCSIVIFRCWILPHLLQGLP